MSLETFLEINLSEHLTWGALQRSTLLLKGKDVWRVSDLLISLALCPHAVKSLVRGMGRGWFYQAKKQELGEKTIRKPQRNTRKQDPVFKCQ